MYISQTIRANIKNALKPKNRHRSLAMLVIGSLVITGLALQIASRAAGPFVSIQPESGTIAPPASSMVDATASGGAAIKFGAATAPTPAPTPLPSDTSRASLLSQRAGFGRNANGGEAGPTVHVTNANDSGPGSLRAAVTGASPKWVVFDGDYTIRLSSEIAVGANTTIDGRGRKVTITGCRTAGSITCANSTSGLMIRNTSNVIVANLTVSGFGNIALTGSNNPYDGVAVEGSDRVWLDHLGLTHAGDKVLVIQSGATNVTVSWSRFYAQEQTFQIGAQFDPDASARQTVTVHHNFFDRTAYRNPVISYGKAHVYNNYYFQWGLYAVRAERAGQMYLERNVFEMGSSNKGALTKPAGNGCNDSGTRCDTRPGYLRTEGNMLIGNVSLPTSSPQLVFVPSASYPYTAQPADVNLKNSVRASAGPR